MFQSKSDKAICPLLKKPCIEKECAWFVTIKGSDPQTGKQIDSGGCSVSWMPIIGIEGNKESQAVAASVVSLREEQERRQKWWVQMIDSFSGGKKLHD